MSTKSEHCNVREFPRGLLSRPDILFYLEKGEILIDPYEPKNLGTNSYDVSLGEWFWREVFPSNLANEFYNPYDRSHVERGWALHKAQKASDILPLSRRRSNFTTDIKGIAPDDKVILLNPGEFILAHTIEFIGSSGPHVTTQMAARSTIGRSRFEITRCAGLGDVGFCYRWTLEVMNTSQFYMMPLVVGRRIGQVMFYGVAAVEQDYISNGKYQPARADEMRKRWDPKDMLPKAYLDREVLSPS